MIRLDDAVGIVRIIQLLKALIRQSSIKATSHLTISMRGHRATGKIKRDNYHPGSCGPSLTDKKSSVSLNVKNR